MSLPEGKGTSLPSSPMQVCVQGAPNRRGYKEHWGGIGNAGEGTRSTGEVLGVLGTLRGTGGVIGSPRQGTGGDTGITMATWFF